jgi:hypothetical protein
MARVTRSKKFAINEDQSATSVPVRGRNVDIRSLLTIAGKDQVPEEPFHNAPFHELPVNNVMPPLQETIAAELKGLKAAYRTAIGAGRKGSRRTRKQKTNTLEDNDIVAEGILSEVDVGIHAPIPSLNTASSISLGRSPSTNLGT